MAEIPLPSRTDGPLGGHRNQRTFQVDQQAGAVYGKDPGVRVPQGAFGVDAGKAFDGVIEPIMEAHDKQVKLYDATKSTEALQAHERTISEEYRRQQLEGDFTKPGFQSEFRSYTSKSTESLRKSLTEAGVSSWAITEAVLKSTGVNESVHRSVGSDVVTANRAAAKVATGTIISDAAKKAYESPTLVAKLLAQVEQDMSLFRGQSTAQDEIAQTLSARRDITKAAILGANKNMQPELARAMLDGLPPALSDGKPLAWKNGHTNLEGTTVVRDPRINGGKWTPIPTYFGGKKYSPDDAADIIYQSDGEDPDNKRKLPGYTTQGAADQASKERSDALRKDVKDFKSLSSFTVEEYASLSKQIEAYEISKQGQMWADKAINDAPDDRVKQQAALAKISNPLVRRQAEADLARAHGWMDQEKIKQDTAENQGHASVIAGSEMNEPGRIEFARNFYVNAKTGRTDPDDAKKAAQLVAMVEHDIGVERSMKTEALKVKKADAVGLAMQGKFYDIDPAVIAELGTMGSVLQTISAKALRKAPDYSDPVVLNKLNQMKRDPEKFANEDLLTKEYLTGLSIPDWKAMSHEQGAVLDNKTPAAKTAMRTRAQIVSDAWKGIKDKDHKRQAEMSKDLDVLIQELEATKKNGEKASSPEIQQFVDRLMLDGEYKGSTMFNDPDVRLFETPPGKTFFLQPNQIHKIPRYDRLLMIEAFTRNKGRAPTDTEVVEWYNVWLNKHYVPKK